MNCYYCGTGMIDGKCVNHCYEKEQERILLRAGQMIRPKNDDIANALLAKFPEFNPRWPDDVQVRWFETFDKLLAEFSHTEINVIQGNKPS